MQKRDVNILLIFHNYPTANYGELCKGIKAYLLPMANVAACF